MVTRDRVEVLARAMHHLVNTVHGPDDDTADTDGALRILGAMLDGMPGYLPGVLGVEVCSACEECGPVMAREDAPEYREIASCGCERCEDCGGVLAGWFDGPLCRACDSGSNRPCDDCERGHGPHYGGCTHG